MQAGLQQLGWHALPSLCNHDNKACVKHVVDIDCKACLAVTVFHYKAGTPIICANIRQGNTQGAMSHQGNTLAQEGLQQLWPCLVGGVQEKCLSCPDPPPTIALYVYYRKVCYLQQQRPSWPSLLLALVSLPAHSTPQMLPQMY